MGQQQTSSATANDAAEGGSLVGSPASTNAAAQVCLTDDSHGLQISRVVSGSPAACAGLVPYFDFVLAVDERELQSVDGHRTQFFKDYVASKRGVVVRLQVLNLRTRTMREVLLTPAPWKASSHSLLGCGVDWRSIGVCIKLCWHLVSREAGSPAAMCNKLHDDGSEYLIGMQQSDSPVLSTFQSAEDLSDRVRGWMERRQTLREYAALKMPAHVPTELILMMYHVPSNQVRSVALHVDVAPHAVSLGLGLASGLLHTIPVDASAGVPQMHLMDHGEEALSTPNKPHPGTRSVTTMSSSIGSTNERHPLQVENTGTFSPSVGNESTHSLTSQLAPGRGPTTEHHHHPNTLPHASSSPPPTPAHPCTSSAETLPAAGTPRAINVPTSSSVVASIPPSGGLKDGSGPHEAPPIISTTTAPLTSTTTATGAPTPVLLEIPPPLRFPLYNPRTHTFREAA